MASPATSPGKYPAGSGLGVSVLLRHFQSFKRLFERVVGREADEQSTPEPPDVRDGGNLDLRAALPADGLEPLHGHDGVALVKRALDVALEVRPGLLRAVPPLANARHPSIDTLHS